MDLFFKLEKNRLKYIFSDVNDDYFCYVANTNMMKCKHMIIFNKIFGLEKSEKHV